MKRLRPTIMGSEKKTKKKRFRRWMKQINPHTRLCHILHTVFSVAKQKQNEALGSKHNVTSPVRRSTNRRSHNRPCSRLADHLYYYCVWVSLQHLLINSGPIYALRSRECSLAGGSKNCERRRWSVSERLLAWGVCDSLMRLLCETKTLAGSRQAWK